MTFILGGSYLCRRRISLKQIAGILLFLFILFWLYLLFVLLPEQFFSGTLLSQLLIICLLLCHLFWLVFWLPFLLTLWLVGCIIPFSKSGFMWRTMFWLIYLPLLFLMFWLLFFWLWVLFILFPKLSIAWLSCWTSFLNGEMPLLVILILLQLNILNFSWIIWLNLLVMPILPFRNF